MQAAEELLLHACPQLSMHEVLKLASQRAEVEQLHFSLQDLLHHETRSSGKRRPEAQAGGTIPCRAKRQLSAQGTTKPYASIAAPSQVKYIVPEADIFL